MLSSKLSLTRMVSRCCCFILAVSLYACAKPGQYVPATIEADYGWILLPFENESGFAMAGENVQSLIETQLRSKGIGNIQVYKGDVDLRQVRERHTPDNYRYALGGSVKRWSYDEHTARNPSVQISLRLHDLISGEQVWQDTRLQRGRGQSSISKVANSILQKQVGKLHLAAGGSDTVHTTNNVAENIVVDRVSRTDARTPVPVTGAINRTTEAEVVLNRHTSVAFYYGANPPVSVLGQFDKLILEPDNVQSNELAALQARGAKTYAYISVGEVGADREYASLVQPDWELGSNAAWGSKVMDLTHPSWQSFLVERVNDLVDAGYRGLFLDTLDSYQLYASNNTQRQAQQSALLKILSTIKQQHPSLALIANRGFEIIEDAASLLEAVAAESLYAAWDNAQQRYTQVSPDDREWLLGKLRDVQSRFNLDIIAIDYVPPAQRDKARTVAKNIARHGFIPWVATPSLDSLGISLLEVMPREVLIIHNSEHSGELHVSPAHRLVATPLEYLGYVPVYIDLSIDALPPGTLKGRYAGAVIWQEPGQAENNVTLNLERWLLNQLDDRFPVAFLGTLGSLTNESLLDKMDLQLSSPVSAQDSVVATQSTLVGYETQPLPRLVHLDNYPVNKGDNVVHLSYSDNKNNAVDMVVTGDWGGYALRLGALDDRLDGSVLWIIDPFVFLSQALQLPAMPQPDVTSENGKRIWFAHIDGDALPSYAEMPGGQLGAEVIENRILDRFKLPHTISIVEGEMDGVLAYRDREKRMFDVARRLFARADVEIATHSYSHPYFWNSISVDSPPGKHNLSIPGYRYSAHREISGSADFIDKHLAPTNKKTEIMLWTGDAVPTAEALADARNRGLHNMNGGQTVISRYMPYLEQVAPMARPIGGQLQVYAPIMNENVYTNDWSGPFDGFRRVIETLELTDKPKRIKPANIYYHFYSGTKIAAIKALEEVYTWTLSQDILPVVASYYAKKVPDFWRAGVARYLDGRWKMSGLGNIRSIRVLDSNIWPDMTSSRGVAGADQLHDGLYIHTNGVDTVNFTLDTSPATMPYLVSANAVIDHWEYKQNALQFRLTGTQPVRLELSGTTSALCRVKIGNETVHGKRTSKGTRLFSFPTTDTGNAILNCRS